MILSRTTHRSRHTPTTVVLRHGHKMPSCGTVSAQTSRPTGPNSPHSLTGPIATVLLVIMLPGSLHVPLCGLLTVLQSIHCDLASIAVLAATK